MYLSYIIIHKIIIPRVLQQIFPLSQTTAPLYISLSCPVALYLLPNTKLSDIINTNQARDGENLFFIFSSMIPYSESQLFEQDIQYYINCIFF